MENNEYCERLIYRCLAGIATETEMQMLRIWLDEKAGHRQLWEKICKELNISEEGRIFYALEDEKAWQNLLPRLRSRRATWKRRAYRYLRYAAVWVLPLLTVAGGWLYVRQGVSEIPKVADAVIEPGASRAILVLGNGEQRPLQGNGLAEVEVTDGVKIRHDRQVLHYDLMTSGDSVWQESTYNTLKVPNGGEFQLVLADGTKVWMNAGSSLHYPVQFSGNERKVFLFGEAYFEVCQDNCRPFYVVADEVYVRVYGTSFNVNTARLTEIQTVLIDGSVAIGQTDKEEEILIKPGELAGFNRNLRQFRVEKVKTEQYIAWKKGYFAFENESLAEIMHMLEKWYDVEVSFTSEALKHLKFTGYLRKYENIGNILEAIQEVVEVRFAIAERTIVVSG